MVMEYCECGSIGDYLKRGNRFAESTIREIAGCCLLGLKHIHSMNAPHGVSGLELNVNE